jgi:chitinase
MLLLWKKILVGYYHEWLLERAVNTYQQDIVISDAHPLN